MCNIAAKILSVTMYLVFENISGFQVFSVHSLMSFFAQRLLRAKLEKFSMEIMRIWVSIRRFDTVIETTKMYVHV